MLEEYEDRLFSKKAFYSGLLCIKNPKESEKVSKYINYLQELENSLPQDIKLAKDMKKINVPVSVVDALFMAGDLQAKRPGMIVAQTLPNDEKIIQQHGRKILIYKNILEGMEPNQEVLDKLVDKKLHPYCNQRGNINFTIGHEVGHSLGVKLSLKKDKEGNRIPIDVVLGFYQGIIEELKADLVSLHNAPFLLKHGFYNETEYYEVLTYGGLRGNFQLNKPNLDKDTHAIGRLIKFNYFLHHKALLFDGTRFNLDFNKLVEANDSLLKEVLSIQVNGEIPKAEEFVKKWGTWSKEAQYLSEVGKKCKIKIYKIVNQSYAESLLS